MQGNGADEGPEFIPWVESALALIGTIVYIKYIIYIDFDLLGIVLLSL